jgi:hypothetical protein
VLRGFDAQELAVRVERHHHRVGHLGDAPALLVGAADDLVIHVGQVHDLVHAVPGHPQGTAEQVLEQERAEVAEVRRVVDRWPARVERDRSPVGRGERLDRAREGVMQAKRPGRRTRRVGAGRDPVGRVCGGELA